MHAPLPLEVYDRIIRRRVHLNLNRAPGRHKLLHLRPNPLWRGPQTVPVLPEGVLRVRLVVPAREAASREEDTAVAGHFDLARVGAGRIMQEGVESLRGAAEGFNRECGEGLRGEEEEAGVVQGEGADGAAGPGTVHHCEGLLGAEGDGGNAVRTEGVDGGDRLAVGAGGM